MCNMSMCARQKWGAFLWYLSRFRPLLGLSPPSVPTLSPRGPKSGDRSAALFLPSGMVFSDLSPRAVPTSPKRGDSVFYRVGAAFSPSVPTVPTFLHRVYAQNFLAHFCL